MKRDFALFKISPFTQPLSGSARKGKGWKQNEGRNTGLTHHLSKGLEPAKGLDRTLSLSHPDVHFLKTERKS